MDAIICFRCQNGALDYETLWSHYSAQDPAGKNMCVMCGRWASIAEAYERKVKSCSDKTRTVCAGCSGCRRN